MICTLVSSVKSQYIRNLIQILHMSCILSFAEFQYRIFWKKSVLSLENESDDCPKRQSSERSIFNHSVIKVTPICFKFTHELHIIIFCWIPVQDSSEKICVEFGKRRSGDCQNVKVPKGRFSATVMKATPICFKFIYELHINISRLIRASVCLGKSVLIF